MAVALFNMKPEQEASLAINLFLSLTNPFLKEDLPVKTIIFLKELYHLCGLQASKVYWSQCTLCVLLRALCGRLTTKDTKILHKVHKKRIKANLILF